MIDVVSEFSDLIADRGRRNYGEQVTIADHCLLTAVAAEEHGESADLIAACLLHDVGHFLEEPDDGFGVHSHGDLGGDWVAARFGPAVSEPVRMHIEAKRYLCVTEPDYHDGLSGASQYTLIKQGGPMAVDEARRFAALPYAQDSLRLRRYEDEYGKRAGVEPPELAYFRSLLEHLEAGNSRP